MKKLLRIILVCIGLSVSNSNFAQVNEYLDHNPVWNVSSMCGVLAPCIETSDYNYFTGADTTINGLVYKKILKKGTGYYSWFGPPPVPSSCQLPPYTYTNTVASYYMRSAGKQMYLRQPFDTAEYLLYDFDLSVGDTLPLSYNNYTNDITVVAIDSFYTSAGYRKKFELSQTSWAQYLLEGVGHSRGFIEPINVPLECGFMLECFSLNDTSYFPSTGLNCDIFAGVHEPVQGLSITISPNPFNSFTEVNFKEEIKNIDFTVYNALGEVVFKESNFSGTKYEIKSDKLSRGIYFLDIKKNSELLKSAKLVVTE